MSDSTREIDMLRAENAALREALAGALRGKRLHAHPAGRPAGHVYGGRTLCGRVAASGRTRFRLAQTPAAVTCKACKARLRVLKTQPLSDEPRP
jgi:hypothetical protein